MITSRHRRLFAAAVASVLAAGLLSGVASSATSSASAAASASPAAAPAPAAASASGFQFMITDQPQPLCSNDDLPGTGHDFTADPSIDRNSCAYVIFNGADITTLSELTAELYEDGEAAPFTTAPTSQRLSPANAYQVDLEPSAAWGDAAGRIRLVIKYDDVQIGELAFYYNNLRAVVDGGAPAEPGQAFDVSGTIVEHVAGYPPQARDTPVPATFKVRLTQADGTVLFTSPAQTAAADGTFTFQVPAGATSTVSPDASTGYKATLSVDVFEATYNDTGTPLPGQTATGRWYATVAGTDGHVIAVTPTNLDITNSFVSSVGWVKPGDTYPSRIIVTNPTAGPLTPAIDLYAPEGSTFVSASGPGTHPVAPALFTWSPGAIPAGGKATLVLASKAATTGALPTIVWRDLSSRAVMRVPRQPAVTSVSHGPKVIPPNGVYDTARYGDRPFPVVPVAYQLRDYQPTHERDLDTVINSPDFAGSTFNLFQEMSLGQLYPHGTVPSTGLATADFPEGDEFEFTPRQLPPASDTCTGGFTFADTPTEEEGSPAYSERIRNGVYQLPGNTEFYGADSGGTGIAGPGQIDSGCGAPGKLVRDAAIIADPEIDYSDFDTDKDGVVDFFMAVFAGCGGNGSSQVPVVLCPYADRPYDNIWPHSSSLEFYFSDEETGLPGYTTDDQLKDPEGKPLWYTNSTYSDMTTTPGPDNLKVFVRVGPYNVNPETAIDKASVISHEYGHSLGLPDFYSDGDRETYGDWNLMATDKSQNMDIFSRQELGWVVPQVLKPGVTPVTGWKDSKEDINSITWQRPDGSPYTLVEGTHGRVQNSQAYVAKLPGRQLLDPAAFDTGEKASRTHVWWSQRGNDFGCAPDSGHNLDLLIPELARISPDSEVTLQFQSLWDIEWDYDYGFVLTTADGENYTSHASLEGYTNSKDDPTAPPKNQCQTNTDNGITGSSGSYAAGTQTIDRQETTGPPTYPPPVFLTDRYDISDLAGQQNGALRFSYATDSGLDRPGWFIDDVKVTVTEPGKAPRDVLVTDFEASGAANDERIYNGGCRHGLQTAAKCTAGWSYLVAGQQSLADHAYYMEMRDRSGFDLDGKGQIDRTPIEFQPGLSLVYTDEQHGYGNVGTPGAPAQSPLDSKPVPGDETPDLSDAAFTAAADRSTFSDSGVGHTDNYVDPEQEEVDSRYPSVENPWRFRYNCLTFKVNSMSGQDNGPPASDGDLTGNVAFTMGAGCGAFDYGYTPPGTSGTGTTPGGGAPGTRPVAKIKVKPKRPMVDRKFKLHGKKSTGNGLTYVWNFHNGGKKVDATGKKVKCKFGRAGRHKVTLIVIDNLGQRDKTKKRFRVRGGPVQANQDRAAPAVSGADSVMRSFSLDW